MADEKKDPGADQGGVPAGSANPAPSGTKTEKRIREIDEVQSFGGGQVRSVEPEVEVSETLHHYSGGEIIERANTTISPWLWGFWITTLVVIVAAIVFYVLPGFFNPAMRGAEARAGNAAGGIGSFNGLSQLQQATMANEAMGSPTMIDMYQLPLPAGQNLSGAVSAGSQVYQTYCIGCHGPNQDGNGPNSVSLDPKPRNLRDVPFMQAMSYQRIWTSVHKGVPGTAMPRWENTLSDTQIQDVIAYVFSLTAPQDSNHNFIRPSAADIAGSAAPSAGNGAATGAEAPHGAAGAPSSSGTVPVPAAITPGSTQGTNAGRRAGSSASLAPATGPGTKLTPHALLTGPITGPPSH